MADSSSAPQALLPGLSKKSSRFSAQSRLETRDLSTKYTYQAINIWVFKKLRVWMCIYIYTYILRLWHLWVFHMLWPSLNTPHFRQAPQGGATRRDRGPGALPWETYFLKRLGHTKYYLYIYIYTHIDILYIYIYVLRCCKANNKAAIWDVVFFAWWIVSPVGSPWIPPECRRLAASLELVVLPSAATGPWAWDDQWEKGEKGDQNLRQVASIGPTSPKISKSYLGFAKKLRGRKKNQKYSLHRFPSHGGCSIGKTIQITD